MLGSSFAKAFRSVILHSSRSTLHQWPPGPRHNSSLKRYEENPSLSFPYEFGFATEWPASLL